LLANSAEQNQETIERRAQEMALAREVEALWPGENGKKNSNDEVHYSANLFSNAMVLHLEIREDTILFPVMKGSF
jgi:hemerythrin-like domain-containing protein